jgi:hypothetical protein
MIFYFGFTTSASPAKVPQVRTHGNVLVDCDVEFKQVIEVLEFLGVKLGPPLL